MNKSKRHKLLDIIKIIPCTEGDRSDSQPEVSSTAWAMVVVEGCQSDLSPSTQGIVVFHYTLVMVTGDR